MDIIKYIFDLTGSLICHQLPDRSLTYGDMVFPVCARDTGIYAGIFTSFIFIMLARRLKAQKPLKLAAAVVMVLLMAPMMADGALSYAGVMDTNNAVRLFTGLFFGLPIPFLLVPAANFDVYGHNEMAVVKRWYEVPLVYLAGVLLAVLLLNGVVPYIAAGFIFTSGFLFLISRLAYTIFARAGIRRKLKLYSLTLLATSAVLSFLYILSVYILQPIRGMLTT